MREIQTFTAIVTAAVAVFGLIGLVIQLKKVERDLKASARGNIYDMGARLKEVFVAHPHLRKHFFDGVPVSPGSDDYERIVAIADYFCLYLEQITTQAINIDPSHRKSWLVYAASIYHKSPMIQSYLSDKKDWYAQDFWAAVDKFAPKPR